MHFPHTPLSVMNKWTCIFFFSLDELYFTWSLTHLWTESNTSFCSLVKLLAFSLTYSSVQILDSEHAILKSTVLFSSDSCEQVLLPSSCSNVFLFSCYENESMLWHTSLLLRPTAASTNSPYGSTWNLL